MARQQEHGWRTPGAELPTALLAGEPLDRLALVEEFPVRVVLDDPPGLSP